MSIAKVDPFMVTPARMALALSAVMSGQSFGVVTLTIGMSAHNFVGGESVIDLSVSDIANFAGTNNTVDLAVSDIANFAGTNNTVDSTVSDIANFSDLLSHTITLTVAPYVAPEEE
jgi:hypothetical protein